MSAVTAEKSFSKLVQLRVSQINGCSVCTDMHARELKKAGQTNERLFALAAWRDTPYFTEPERAALAEATTRLSDRIDPVPDEVWNEAARHYAERALAALVVQIGLIDTFNRLNAATSTCRKSGGNWQKRESRREKAVLRHEAVEWN